MSALITSTAAKGGPRCPICGMPGATCGHSNLAGIPVDLPTGGTMAEEEGVGDLSRYAVVVNGVETIMNLTAAHAKNMGLSAKDKRPRGEPQVTMTEREASATQAQHKARGVAAK
jgi:hypothetical protein